MYLWFKAERRDDILQGRTIKYVSERLLECGYAYLSLILQGKQYCSKRLAKDIVAIAGTDAKIEDYFELRER